MLKLVHTADWHLGRHFRSFPEDRRRKLSRARLEVLERILRAADSHAVDAVLCAGDLFDEPHPDKEWWEQAAALLKKSTPSRPVFLLPGNHDPLTAESIWTPGARDSASCCRRGCTSSIALISSTRFRTARCCTPCRACRKRASAIRRSRSRNGRQAMSASASGWCTAARSTQRTGRRTSRSTPTRCSSCGLDYLAIGDTHGFRYVPPDRKHPPTIYPGAPEATAFDEKDPGCVAVVFINRQRMATRAAGARGQLDLGGADGHVDR